jgi:hypothetical protein
LAFSQEPNINSLPLAFAGAKNAIERFEDKLSNIWLFAGSWAGDVEGSRPRYPPGKREASVRHPAGAREGAGRACYASWRTRRSSWSLRSSWELWKIKQWRRYPGHSIRFVEGKKLRGILSAGTSNRSFPSSAFRPFGAPSAAGQIVRQRPIQRGPVSAVCPPETILGIRTIAAVSARFWPTISGRKITIIGIPTPRDLTASFSPGTLELFSSAYLRSFWFILRKKTPFLESGLSGFQCCQRSLWLWVIILAFFVAHASPANRIAMFGVGFLRCS